MFGFGAGLIPAPYVDIPILYSINLSMILKIGKCFSVEFNEIPNWDRVKLVMGFEANVESTAKVVGNKLAAEGGEELGKNLVKDLGKEGTHQIAELARKGHEILSTSSFRS